MDFFTGKDLDTQAILTIVELWRKRYGFAFTSEFLEVVYIFLLTFKNNLTIKVDFGRYPYGKIEEEKIIDGIKVDSLTDIAVNKLSTITQRTAVKDFVDLYFLLKDFSLWDLLEGVRIKFRTDLELFTLASDFLKVERFDYLPKMIKPLTLEELKDFFREKAKEVGKKAII